ncbi:hypothetical protein [Nocardia sp. NPDC051570]|uniref:hypothetical protein n=1 Tax=Nocardia sp. NPDC051570 TaxID=3364324 RepID=UPI0037AD7C81
MFTYVRGRRLVLFVFAAVLCALLAWRTHLEPALSESNRSSSATCAESVFKFGGWSMHAIYNRCGSE